MKHASVHSKIENILKFTFSAFIIIFKCSKSSEVNKGNQKHKASLVSCFPFGEPTWDNSLNICFIIVLKFWCFKCLGLRYPEL